MPIQFLTQNYSLNFKSYIWCCSLCYDCVHCIYIGEGDSICDAGDVPRLVLEDWTPADDFLWCASSEFESDEEGEEDEIE